MYVYIYIYIHCDDNFSKQNNRHLNQYQKVPGDSYVGINNIYNIIFFCKLLSYISTILIYFFCCCFVSF